ncbi:hypothetical protein NADFUDRAFT_41966 [Nadsonia fulvescens var. elongata DSM 6958]|uniref:Uncharacterized protein n=1 Tax=Nadsonia fulvescens var. elongata DSM 6958 TaxID=857566 RepID=A0A1E3PL17_9ASCO|nr:hypothetical protein NADFUDRAFT_41966 [Nadsonia fulvescens var. elongata DSM 6958]
MLMAEESNANFTSILDFASHKPFITVQDKLCTKSSDTIISENTNRKKVLYIFKCLIIPVFVSARDEFNSYALSASSRERLSNQDIIKNLKEAGKSSKNVNPVKRIIDVILVLNLITYENCTLNNLLKDILSNESLEIRENTVDSTRENQIYELVCYVYEYLTVLFNSPLKKQTKSFELWNLRKWLIANFTKLPSKLFPHQSRLHRSDIETKLHYLTNSAHDKHLLSQYLDQVEKSKSTSAIELLLFILSELLTISASGYFHPTNYYSWNYCRWFLTHFVIVNGSAIDNNLLDIIINAFFDWSKSSPSDCSRWSILSFLLASLLQRQSINTPDELNYGKEHVSDPSFHIFLKVDSILTEILNSYVLTFPGHENVYIMVGTILKELLSVSKQNCPADLIYQKLSKLFKLRLDVAKSKVSDITFQNYEKNKMANTQLRDYRLINRYYERSQIINSPKT